MYTVKLTDRKLDFPRIDEAVHSIPSGMNVWSSEAEEFDLTDLRCFDALKDISRLECSLGTLGGGNHFIEVDKDDEGNKYLLIHTGSRNLGLQVASIYQKKAGKKAVTEAIIGFCEYLENKGYWVGIYASDLSGFKEIITIIIKLKCEKFFSLLEAFASGSVRKFFLKN